MKLKLDLMTAMTLLTTLAMKGQDIWKDNTITVGELYNLLGEIIKQLNLEDKVIFHKEHK